MKEICVTERNSKKVKVLSSIKELKVGDDIGIYDYDGDYETMDLVGYGNVVIIGDTQFIIKWYKTHETKNKPEYSIYISDIIKEELDKYLEEENDDYTFFIKVKKDDMMVELI